MNTQSQQDRRAPDARTLDIRVLGAAEVRLAGQEVRWPTASARDLLFYLLAHPAGRAKEDILDALWGVDPDAQSANRFRVTAHRLRAALGDPGALGEAYGRYALAPWVFGASDVGRARTAIEQAAHATDDAARTLALQRAVQAYGGPFLPDHRADWATAARDEIKAAYVKCSVELAMLHCDAARCDAAVGSLGRALAADPLIGENYHQELMACLTAVEDRYGAVEHYRRFLRMLRDDLGDSPMQETVGLARELKAGGNPCPRHIGRGTPCTRRVLSPASCAPYTFGDAAGGGVDADGSTPDV